MYYQRIYGAASRDIWSRSSLIAYFARCRRRHQYSKWDRRFIRRVAVRWGSTSLFLLVWFIALLLMCQSILPSHSHLISLGGGVQTTYKVYTHLEWIVKWVSASPPSPRPQVHKSVNAISFRNLRRVFFLILSVYFVFFASELVCVVSA